MSSAQDGEGTGEQRPTGGEPDRDGPVLPPIPSEGTSAPARPEQAFGQRPAKGQRASGHGRGGAADTGQDMRRPEGTAGVSAGEPGPGGPSDRSGAGWTGSRGSPWGVGGRTGSGAFGSGPGHGELSENERRTLVSRGRLALVLGAGALVFSVLLFPLGLALGVAALVLGALALRGGRPSGYRAPGAGAGVVLGVVSTLIASVFAVLVSVFWTEINEFQQCTSGANTLTSQAACREALEQRLAERLGTE